MWGGAYLGLQNRANPGGGFSDINRRSYGNLVRFCEKEVSQDGEGKSAGVKEQNQHYEGPREGMGRRN